LLMLFIFLLIAMLVFATMIYYAERQDATKPSEQFTTIPMGFWWAIITMTTVGYGDVHPVTTPGYIVGTMCCVAGVLLVALTFPVISNNFTLFYQHVRSRPSRASQARGSQGSIHSPAHSDRGSGLKGGGASKRGRGEEEEYLLRASPHSSPTRSVPRKESFASAVTEPLMNGGASCRPGAGRPSPSNAYSMPPPTLARFSDSTSMTDIVLSRQGQGFASPDKDSLHRRQGQGQGRVQGHGWERHRSQGSASSTRGGSLSSRKTASDAGETRL
jgi:hypothetical protein